MARYEVSFPSRIVRKGNGWFIPIKKEYVEMISRQDTENDYDILVSVPKGNRE